MNILSSLLMAKPFAPPQLGRVIRLADIDPTKKQFSPKPKLGRPANTARAPKTRIIPKDRAEMSLSQAKKAARSFAANRKTAPPEAALRKLVYRLLSEISRLEKLTEKRDVSSCKK